MESEESEERRSIGMRVGAVGEVGEMMGGEIG